LSCGNVSVRQAVKAGQTECVLPSVQLPAGPNRLEASLAEGSVIRGVRYVEVKRVD
jgi:hypothetical protein